MVLNELSPNRKLPRSNKKKVPPPSSSKKTKPNYNGEQLKVIKEHLGTLASYDDRLNYLTSRSNVLPLKAPDVHALAGLFNINVGRKTKVTLVDEICGKYAAPKTSTPTQKKNDPLTEMAKMLVKSQRDATELMNSMHKRQCNNIEQLVHSQVKTDRTVDRLANNVDTLTDDIGNFVIRQLDYNNNNDKKHLAHEKKFEDLEQKIKLLDASKQNPHAAPEMISFPTPSKSLLSRGDVSIDESDFGSKSVTTSTGIRSSPFPSTSFGGAEAKKNRAGNAVLLSNDSSPSAAPPLSLTAPMSVGTLSSATSSGTNEVFSQKDAVNESVSDNTYKSEGWGSMFKNEGSWRCGECMVQNESSDTICVVCEALKPGEKGKSSSNASEDLIRSLAMRSISGESPGLFHAHGLHQEHRQSL